MEQDPAYQTKSTFIYSDETNDGAYSIIVRLNKMHKDGSGILEIFSNRSFKIELTLPVEISSATIDGQPPTENEITDWRQQADDFLSG